MTADMPIVEAASLVARTLSSYSFPTEGGGDVMAEYNPPQPLWKRVVAGILDFVLAFTVFAILTVQVTGTACPADLLARATPA